MSTTIRVVCSHCGMEMNASSQFIGRTGKCPNPKCGQLIKIIPAAGEQVPPVPAAGTAAAPATKAAAGRSVTEANPWLALVLGAVLAVIVYSTVTTVLGQTYIGRRFINSGPVGFIETLVTCWGFAILGLKYRAVQKQLGYADLELELIPLEIGTQITPENVDQFVQHLERLPKETKNSILGRRIHGALEHFKSRNDVPEVQQYLSNHAEIDASQVDSGYTLLRAIIWCVPILGFIGTVVGISAAVEGLAEQLPAAPVVAGADGQRVIPAEAVGEAGPKEGTAAAVMKAMGTVTQGLATAFDTTFIGLVMAIMLLFPTETLRKTEFGMLDRIEAFLGESVLRRFADKQSLAADGGAQALESAFAQHQRWLAEWQQQVAELGEIIGARFEAHANRIQEQLESVGLNKAEELREAAVAFESVMEQLRATTESFAEASRIAGETLREPIEAVTALQQELAENTRGLAAACEQWRATQHALESSDVAAALARLSDQLARMSDGSNLETLSPITPPRLDGAAESRGFLRRLFGAKRT